MGTKRMENGEWRLRGWRTENGEWRMEKKTKRIKNGE